MTQLLVNDSLKIDAYKGETVLHTLNGYLLNNNFD